MKTILTILIFLSYAATSFASNDIHIKVDKLLIDKEFDKAESVALEALKQQPNDPDALCALACVYRNKSYKSVMNVDITAMGLKEGESGSITIPDGGNINDFASEIKTYDTDIHKKAEDLYLKIIDIDPNYENAYYNLINDYALVYDFDNYFKIVDLFIKNIKDDELKKDALMDLAGKLAKNEAVHLDHPIEMYKKILNVYPEFSNALCDLAVMYQYKGDVNISIPLFKKAYELDKNDEITLTYYLNALILNEDFEIALTLSNELSKKQPMYSYLSGMLAYLLNKPHKKYFDEFAAYRLEETGKENDFWYSNAMEFQHLDDKIKDELIDFFQYQLDNFRQPGYKSEAVVAGNLVLKIDTTNFALLVMAQLYDKSNIIKKSIKYLDLIKERRAIDPSIMSEYNLNFNYGRIHLANDKFKEAKQYFLKLNRENDQDARVNYSLGLCCLGLSQKDEAIAYFRKNAAMQDKEQLEWINQSIWKLKELGVAED